MARHRLGIALVQTQQIPADRGVQISCLHLIGQIRLFRTRRTPIQRPPGPRTLAAPTTILAVATVETTLTGIVALRTAPLTVTRGIRPAGVVTIRTAAAETATGRLTAARAAVAGPTAPETTAHDIVPARTAGLALTARSGITRTAAAETAFVAGIVTAEATALTRATMRTAAAEATFVAGVVATETTTVARIAARA